MTHNFFFILTLNFVCFFAFYKAASDDISTVNIPGDRKCPSYCHLRAPCMTRVHRFSYSPWDALQSAKGEHASIADELHWTDEVESRHRLRSGSCPRLIVPRTRLSTIGDRSFRVTVARAWNSLPTSITALTSLPSLKRQLKTFLFTESFPSV